MKKDLITKSGLHIVSGPTKSGKSKWAESLLLNLDNVIYIASFESNYEEADWVKRVEIHKKRRPKAWKTFEDYKNLADLINTFQCNESILLDSLGGFIYQNINLDNYNWEIRSNQLVTAVKRFPGFIVIVVEETGWGISPNTQVGNLFRDRLGQLSLDLNQFSSEYWLVNQGYALNLKQLGIKVI